MLNKKISVVLPVYNGGEYVKLSVESVLKQSYADFELLICDDSSTDGSREYLSTLHDSRIRLFRNKENKTLFPTLNFLCKQTSGGLIKLWCQDDVMNVNCLQETVSFHSRYPDISFSYSDRQIIDEVSNLIVYNFNDSTPEYIPRQLHDRIALYTGSIAGNISNVTVVKRVFEEAGYFNEKMIICADFEMWVKLTERYDIGRIAKPLVKIRNHPAQLSRNPKYLLSHLKEDREVFSILFARVDPLVREIGLKEQRWGKHVFYFSLMLQAARRLDWKTASQFWGILSLDDNIFFLFMRWFFVKVKRIINWPVDRENKFLFKTDKSVKNK